jgi:hypothetical protein
MTATAGELHLRPAPFVMPKGVEEADRVRLSPEPGDASLIQQLRRDLTAKDQTIDALQADVRTQANIIADFQAEHALTLAHTFEITDSIANLSPCVAALVQIGHDVVMRFELVDDRRALNVYIKDDA